MELLKFKFQDEPESLTNAIQHIQSDTNIKTYTKLIIIKYGKIAFEVNQDFFILKLYQSVDDIYKHPDSYKIDKTYLQMLNVCLKSKLVFQHFYSRTALTIMKYECSPSIQKFWDQFIFDIRIRQSSIEHFCKLYSDDLYFLVKILCDVCFCSDFRTNDKSVDYLVRSLLRNVRSKDKLKFLIITTHFNKYSHLLKY